MTDQQQPPVAPITHTEALLQASADIQNLAQGILQFQRQLNAAVPMEVVVLTATEPVWTSDVGEGLYAKSLGVLNPHDFTIRLGVGGTSATARGRGVPVPARTLMVLPIDVRDLEVGPNDVADLAAGDAVLYLFRFHTVQPAFMGGI